MDLYICLNCKLFGYAIANFIHMFTIDAHLDLSMNAMEWNRDLRKSIQEIRDREKGMTDKPDRGNGVVCFPGVTNREILVLSWPRKLRGM